MPTYEYKTKDCTKESIVDHIFVSSGLSSPSSDVLDLDISDHKAITTTIHIPRRRRDQGTAKLQIYSKVDIKGAKEKFKEVHMYKPEELTNIMMLTNHRRKK